MLVTVHPGIVYAYNEGEQKLIIISEDTDDNTFYSICGWFGKKLYEILEEKRELDEVLENDFKNRDELKIIFLRFILTLIEKNVLSPLPDQHFSHRNTFSENECHRFGTSDFIGNIITTEIDTGKLFAQANPSGPSGVFDTYHTYCRYGHRHLTRWSSESIPCSM